MISFSTNLRGLFLMKFADGLMMPWTGSRSLNKARLKETFSRSLSSSTTTSPRPCPSYNVIKEPGKVSPLRSLPSWIEHPPYAQSGFLGLGYKSQKIPQTPEVKNERQIKGMRNACKVARDVLEKASELVKPGVTTEEIDIVVHESCIQHGCYPSPLTYKGYPKSVCTSVNNVACHGIPDDRQLQHGDIINIDVTVFYKGFHGDLSQTYLVGGVDEEGRRLVDCAKRCRDEAIDICAPGIPLFCIGHMIEHIAEEDKLNVIPYFCGHGIGEYFHGPPDIFHYANDTPGEMVEGMTFTIEPIISEGSGDVRILDDGWTAVSTDGSRSAQFEHTILITSNGCDILTL